MKASEMALCTVGALNLTAEKTLRWQRSQMFLLLHSAGVTFTLTHTSQDFRFFLTTGAIGLLLCVIWGAIIWRTEKWVQFWQNRLIALENSEPDENQVRIFSGQEFQTASHWPTFNFILWGLAGLVTVVWFGIFVAGLSHPLPPVPAGK